MQQIDIEQAIGERKESPLDRIRRMRVEKRIQLMIAQEYKILFARQTVFNLNKRGVGVIGYFAESLKNTVWPDQFHWYG